MTEGQQVGGTPAYLPVGSLGWVTPVWLSGMADHPSPLHSASRRYDSCWHTAKGPLLDHAWLQSCVSWRNPREKDWTGLPSPCSVSHRHDSYWHTVEVTLLGHAQLWSCASWCSPREQDQSWAALLYPASAVDAHSPRKGTCHTEKDWAPWRSDKLQAVAAGTPGVYCSITTCSLLER